MSNDSFFGMLLSHIDSDDTGNNKDIKLKQIIDLTKTYSRQLNAQTGCTSLDEWTGLANNAIEHSPEGFDTVMEEEGVDESLKAMVSAPMPVLVAYGKDIQRMKREYRSAVSLAKSRGVVHQDANFGIQRPYASFIRLVRSKTYSVHQSFMELKTLGFIPPACDGVSRNEKDWKKFFESRTVASIATAEALSLNAINNQTSKAVGSIKPTSTSKSDCDLCGRRNHDSEACFFKKHPDRNTEKGKFVTSVKGLAYKAKFGIKFLMPNKVLSEDADEVARFEKIFDEQMKRGSKGRSVSSLSLNDSLPVINAVLIFKQERIKIRVGFDSHAQGDFMSRTLADSFSEREDRRGGNARICSAFSDCIVLDGLLPVDINFFDQHKNHITIRLNVFVAPIPYDLLMGIASMRVHRIVSVHFPKLFEEIFEPQLDLGSDPVLVEDFSSLTCLENDTVSSEHTCNCMSSGGTLTQDLELQVKEPTSVSPTEGIPLVQNTWSRTPTPLDQHFIRKLVDLVPREEESNRTSEVIPPTYSLSALRQTPLYRYNQKPLRMIVRQGAAITDRAFAPIVAEFDGLFDNTIPAQPEDFIFKIHGSPEFQAKVRALNKKYDVFSTSVRSEPADVTPMEVKVDLEAWRRPANAGPPRKQSLLKEKAILGQITPLLDSKVIQPSMQPFYSQVHMVSKVTSPTEPGDLDFVLI
jgi:hypothetical protein